MRFRISFELLFLSSYAFLSAAEEATDEKPVGGILDVKEVLYGFPTKFLADAPLPAIGGANLQVLNPAPTKSSRRRGLRTDGSKKGTTSARSKCDKVVLEDYRQWRAEKGYWIGEYSLYQADGTPTQSSTWPYPYDAYRGFITGNVEGNAYRQRNIFLYPPLPSDKCATRDDPKVVGDGTCGENGNSLVFSADQSATTCSKNPELGGDITGVFSPNIDTTTELVGADNALLYQVWLSLPDGTRRLFQSQLTTITEDSAGTTRRTRTAQQFTNFASPGVPSGISFYREKKVSKEKFYEDLKATVADYKIRSEDLCSVDGISRKPIPDIVPGIDTCMSHLEQSFEL